MEVVIRQHEQQCGVNVADIFADAVTSGATTLGLATGSSPLSVYRELIRRHRQEGLTFADVQAFLLDEYVGLPPDHPQSYAHVIRAEFTDHVDIDSTRVHSPNGVADDIFVAAEEYDAFIDDVPRHVITQGLGTISAARHLVLIATGSHKAEAIAAAVEGPLTASCPGSVLQLHPHVTVVVDDAAAAQLKNADFYRYALRYKPAQLKH